MLQEVHPPPPSHERLLLQPVPLAGLLGAERTVGREVLNQSNNHVDHLPGLSKFSDSSFVVSSAFSSVPAALPISDAWSTVSADFSKPDNIP